jgi:uncharacterized protein (DUF433 family)
MVYRGKVRGGVVVLAAGTELPEGLDVIVEPVQASSSETSPGGLRPCRIVDRGDGPKIEGTRITVYTVLEYLRHGHSRDWIAAMFGLSSQQVQAAIDYIQEHSAEVNADYEKILERIRRGNPPWVEERLKQNRAQFEALRARCRGSADEDRA